jgi:hypothetical protein
MPKRIQRKRVKGWRMPPNTVYVGKPSRFWNPFHGAFTNERAVELFRGSNKLKYLIESGQIAELKGNIVIIVMIICSLIGKN